MANRNKNGVTFTKKSPNRGMRVRGSFATRTLQSLRFLNKAQKKAAAAPVTAPKEIGVIAS